MSAIVVFEMLTSLQTLRGRRAGACLPSVATLYPSFCNLTRACVPPSQVESMFALRDGVLSVYQISRTTRFSNRWNGVASCLFLGRSFHALLTWRTRRTLVSSCLNSIVCRRKKKRRFIFRTDPRKTVERR
jgi:hypothetical protein